LVGCLWLTLALWGCGSSDGLVNVSGTVKADGAPIEDGAITFVPTDGKSPTAGGVIKNGLYSSRVAPGEMKVQITAPKIVGTRSAYNTPDSPKVNIVEELLPAKYNVNTELIRKIEPGKTYDFDLSTK
jgi:hypothetical protein